MVGCLILRIWTCQRLQRFLKVAIEKNLAVTQL